MFRSKVGLSFSLSIIFCLTAAQSKCPNKTCDLALASYYVWPGTNLTFISTVSSNNITDILSFNPQITNESHILTGTRINLPFTCDCINDEFLGHTFPYVVQPGDWYSTIAHKYYANLSTTEMLEQFNRYPAAKIPVNALLNVTVNCSCGDASVSNASSLFITYPLRAGESLKSIAAVADLSMDLLQRYNQGFDFSAGSGLVYFPYNDYKLSSSSPKSSPGLSGAVILGISIGVVMGVLLGLERVLNSKGCIDNNSSSSSPKSSTGLSGGVKIGISMGVVMGVLLVSVGIYFGFCRKKKADININVSKTYEDLPLQAAPGSTSVKSGFIGAPRSDSSRSLAIIVDKPVQFSNEELAKATNDFNEDKIIGRGGFGAVYYAELRGEKAAIKKMDMGSKKEFLAELNVLTRVHHLNLVRLIGYCAEGSLFLVYEYIDNGTLSQHLHDTERNPLPWSARVQIALHSARGLEYIHEHTAPVYIHRDVKSANILIDKNFHAKVADFGLTRLAEVRVTRNPAGTFGYMPPEYIRFGDVSPKLDVYSLGVVLYELISAKNAIVESVDSPAEPKALVDLFEEAFNKPDPIKDLCKLIDPRLGDNRPLDSVVKMAQLAKACTDVNPRLRPGMRSVFEKLVTLSSSTEYWDVDSFHENQVLDSPSSSNSLEY